MTTDEYKNIYVNQGDAIGITINTLGTITAEVGNTATLMVKRNVSDPSNSALLTKTVSITSANTINIDITSTENTIPAGEYFWSVRLKKDTDYYTMIPDDAMLDYPNFIVKEVFIDE